MKRYLVIFGPNSHDKLTKSKFGSISINVDIVQNNMFIIKGVVFEGATVVPGSQGVIIMCTNKGEKFTKGEIGSYGSWS